MNLRITSKAKNNQIAFLIALDNFISKSPSMALKRLEMFIKKRNPQFNFQAKERDKNRIDMYDGNQLIAYYS